MNRLFISLNIPDNIIDSLVELRKLCWDDDNIKQEPKEKLHVTLKFIGDVNQSKTDDLVDRLRFINDYSAFGCILENFGFFFRDGTPSILWAGLNIDEKIIKLIKHIEEILDDLSIISDKKKFKPHITLTRLRKDPGNDFVNTFKNFSFEPIIFQSNSITLYKSVLELKGSRYYEIKKYFLK